MPMWVQAHDQSLVNLDNADAVILRVRPGPGSTREHPVPSFTVCATFGDREIALRKDLSEEDMNQYMAWLSWALGVKGE